MRKPIKTSYDRTILTMAAEGATSTEVAAAIGKTLNQIYNRAMHLGVWRDLVKARRDRRLAREDRQRTKPKLHGYQRSQLAAALIPPARIDRTATDLANTLRAARRRADPAAPVPASFIARVFAAGLTLDEIDATYAVPPVEAVAAIRQHPEIRP